MGEHLLRRRRGTHEHERAPVALQQRGRRGAEPPVQSKQAYDPIHGLTEQHRDRGGLDGREPEALVAQPVQVVAGVAAGQPKPRPQFLDDRVRLVEMELGGDIEVHELACRKLAELGVAGHLAAGSREVVACQSTAGEPGAARLAAREVVRGEWRRVRRAGPAERAHPSWFGLEAGLELDRDPHRRGCDEHRLRQRAERQEQIPPRRVACRERPRRIEAELDPVRLVLQDPGLRVVRRWCPEELRLQSPQVAQIAHVTSRA